MQRLIILDRDGVINEDSDDFIKSPDEWHPIKHSLEAITELNKAGFIIAVATNQSGVARGLYSEQTLSNIHAKMTEALRLQGGEFAHIAYCPHGPNDHCQCRKPLPGLVFQIEAALGISAKNAYFVGDALRDLQAAHAAGCIPVLVKTGKGEKTLSTPMDGLENVLVFHSLYDFSQFVVTQ